MERIMSCRRTYLDEMSKFHPPNAVFTPNLTSGRSVCVTPRLSVTCLGDLTPAQRSERHFLHVTFVYIPSVREREPRRLKNETVHPAHTWRAPRRRPIRCERDFKWAGREIYPGRALTSAPAHPLNPINSRTKKSHQVVPTGCPSSSLNTAFYHGARPPFTSRCAHTRARGRAHANTRLQPRQR